MDTDPFAPQSPPTHPRARLPGPWTWLLGGLALMGVVGLTVFAPLQDRAKATADNEQVPTVAVARAAFTALANQETWYAEFRPYQEIDVHAKVSGYLSSILVDFGDRVKEGQLLATLEVPELGADLDHALAVRDRSRADVNQAQAAYDEAKEIDTHLEAAAKANPKLFAQQDIDVAADKARNAAAALASAREQVREAEANVNKLQTMCGYTNIWAPFTGVITKRYADKGSLIQAGTASDTQSEPLVRLSQNYLLRLDFPVEISYVARIKAGDPVDITVQGLTNTFRGTVTRSTRRVEFDTRKMIVEVEVPNPNLEIIPGMYAWVTWNFNQRTHALTVPTEAVSHENPPTVYRVTADHTIELRPVTVGLTTPTEVEIVAGLKANDLVMIGDRTYVKPGQKVEPKLVEPATVAGTEAAN